MLYHGVARPGSKSIPAGERKFWITNLQFTEQMEEIQSRAYRVGLLSELWWLSNFAAKASVLALTFDDGHETDYSVAFPLLQKFGFRADFFINTATVGTPGRLTWDQMGEMHRAGMSFQSHGHDHVDLSHMPLSTLRWQLGHSKSLIEDRLGHPVEFLSAPYGLFNQQVLEAAIAVGYRAVCTSRNWPARLGEIPISRVSIHSHTSRREFEGLLANELSVYATRTVREALLYLPKQILLRINPAILIAPAKETPSEN